MSDKFIRILVQSINQHTRLFSFQRSVILYNARTKAAFEYGAIHLEIRMIEIYVERAQVALRKFCVHPYFWTIRIDRGSLIEQFCGRLYGIKQYDMPARHAEGDDGP